MTKEAPELDEGLVIRSDLVALSVLIGVVQGVVRAP